MSKRVYVAAPLTELARAREAAAVVLQLGLRLASRWHDDVAPGQMDPVDENVRRDIAEDLAADLQRADILVALADQGRPRGTLVEVGWALARGLPVLWLAPVDVASRCVFDSHPLVRRIHGWAELVRGLEAAGGSTEPP